MERARALGAAAAAVLAVGAPPALAAGRTRLPPGRRAADELAVAIRRAARAGGSKSEVLVRRTRQRGETELQVWEAARSGEYAAYGGYWLWVGSRAGRVRVAGVLEYGEASPVVPGGVLEGPGITEIRFARERSGHWMTAASTLAPPCGFHVGAECEATGHGEAGPASSSAVAGFLPVALQIVAAARAHLPVRARVLGRL